MLNKTYHCITKALVTKQHAEQKQQNNLAILATIGESGIADLQTTGRFYQCETQSLRRRSGIGISNGESELHLACQALYA